MVEPLKELLYISGLQFLNSVSEIGLGYNINKHKTFNIVFERSSYKRKIKIGKENIIVFGSSENPFKVNKNTLYLFNMPKTIEAYLTCDLKEPNKPIVNLIAKFFREIVITFLSRHNIDIPIIYPLPGNMPILFLSHDVDLLRYSKPYDIFRIGKLKQLSDYFALFNIRFDRYWNIDKIINWEKDNRVKSTFFFITVKRDAHAKRYSLKEAKSTIELLRNKNIEIGLHLPDFKIINREIVENEYRKIIKYARIYGIRKHYLADNFLDYISSIQGTNIKYDSTAGFRNKIGFKIGTSYPVWYGDILEIPLLIMDSAYINTGHHLPSEYFDAGGILSILFHNHILSREYSNWWKRMRELILNFIQKRHISMSGSDIFNWRRQIDTLSVSLYNSKVIVRAKDRFSDYPIVIGFKRKKYSFYSREVNNETIIN